MSLWHIQKSPFFDSRFKKFEKRHKDEALNLVYNAQSYFDALPGGAKVLAIAESFIHPETEGLIAVDQRNRSLRDGRKKKGRKQMKESRLYLYPDETNRTLVFLSVGDKDSQARDLRVCKEYVRGLKGSEGQS